MQTEKQYPDIDQLIDLYFTGKADKASLAKLENWIHQSEEHQKYVRNKVELWFSASVSGDVTDFDKDKAFERFKQRITTAPKAHTSIRPIFWKHMGRAAAIVLILLLPFATYWKGKETIKQTFADMTVEAPMGARTKLYLPDGTLVWLNAGSKITYSQGFGVDDRCLSLEGEGYFEVTHNKEIPFEIKTHEVGLKVLGTKFNFKNYPDDKEITVNLMEGKVALQNKLRAMPELYLEPSEKMTLNKQTGEMKKTRTNVTNSNIWTQDELFFDEELLEDIAKKLMRSYDIKIEIADSLKNHRFYGSFKIMGNTIDEVLETIASTNRMKYRYENEKYILY